MFASSDTRRRRLRQGAGLAALVLAGAAGLAGGRGSEAERSVRVQRGDLVLTAEIEGELAAVRSAEIGAPAVEEWEFKIAFLAPEGGEVKEGDPVLGFDAEKLQRLLDQKSAELKEAEGKLAQTAIEARLKSLELEQQIAAADNAAGKSRLKAEVPEELLGRVEAEKVKLEHEARAQELATLRAQQAAERARAEAESRSLTAQRDRARGRVGELARSIERLTQRAPQDGIVLHRTDPRGEKKKVGDQIWRGESVVSIPDLTALRGNAFVDEADGGQIAVGQPVTLRLDARPDVDIRGRVGPIGRTVRRKSSRVPAKAFKLEVELEETDPAIMRPAMRFRGEVETGRLKGRLLLPREAVRLGEAGPFVEARRLLGWRPVPIRLGRANRRVVEVVSGLTEGDIVRLEAEVPLAAAGSTPIPQGSGR